MLKELIVTKEDGVSPRDVSRSPAIEVGGERDTIINRSAAVSMTEFREFRTTVDDLRVELKVKDQLDKDVSRSPFIEVGEEKKMSNNNSTSASMTRFRETKSTEEDLRVELEVKSQLDRDRTHTKSEVGG
jgi:hypothetical protein